MEQTVGWNRMALTRDLHWHSQSSRSCHAIVCLENLDDLASTGNGHHHVDREARAGQHDQVAATQSRSIMGRSLFGCSRHHEHTVTQVRHNESVLRGGDQS